MSEKKQRELRVRCLVLDHDDTVVKSTPEINFPAFLRSLKDLRGTTMNYERDKPSPAAMADMRMYF